MSVMIGIDPHKGSHTAVVINGDEVVIDEIRVRASATQVGELQEWASGFEDRCWAVESARVSSEETAACISDHPPPSVRAGHRESG